jgi:chromosome segregation ATPase
MIDRDADALPTLESIAELIKGFQQDATTRLDRLKNNMEEIRGQILGLDVRQDRLISQMYDARADIKVLTAEVRAWAKDVVGVKQELGRL